MLLYIRESINLNSALDYFFLLYTFVSSSAACVTCMNYLSVVLTKYQFSSFSFNQSNSFVFLPKFSFNRWTSQLLFMHHMFFFPLQASGTFCA